MSASNVPNATKQVILAGPVGFERNLASSTYSEYSTTEACALALVGYKSGSYQSIAQSYTCLKNR